MGSEKNLWGEISKGTSGVDLYGSGGQKSPEAEKL